MDEEEARPRPKPELARDLRPMSVVELEAYIARMYAETADFVRAHPLGRDEPPPADDA